MDAIDLKRQKLIAATDYVGKLTRAGVPAATIIDGFAAP